MKKLFVDFKESKGLPSGLSDSKSIVEILYNRSKTRTRAKPFLDYIQELCQGRNVLFSYISRQNNLAGYEAEGHPCNKRIRDIEREILSRAKRKRHLHTL